VRTYHIKCGELDTICQGVTPMQAAMTALRFIPDRELVDLWPTIYVETEGETETDEFSLTTIIEMMQLAYNPVADAVFEVDRP
jgi:hypothetical protein